ncbi:CHASE2 domain-containing protein [Desulfococcus sp.]|uniref:CHASE2 domain-containing protein n=1 Tax=Desulfococcus sp. TaxID=2025834 RepID=UPI00359344DA
MFKRKTDWWVFPAVCLALGATLSMEYLGGFGGLDRYVYDLFFRIRGERPADSRIVVVAIDEKTLRKLGAWPIKRGYYADLIDRVRQADAVGLNVILAEASDEDARLKAAQQPGCPVFLPVYIDREAGIVNPDPGLAGFPTGHIHVDRDIDGVIRNVFHTLYHDRKQMPSFAAALYNALPGREFRHTGRPVAEAAWRISSRIQQVDPMAINFYGDGGTFQRLSFSDVIDGRWAPSFFQNRVVLVGPTAAGLENEFLTPFSNDRNLLPAVILHANILNNLLDGSFIQPVGSLATAFWGLLPSALGFLIFLRFGVARTTLIWIGSLSAWMILGFSLFSIKNVWLPPGAVAAELTVTFLAAYIVKLRQMRQMLETAKIDWEKSFDTIDDGIVIFSRDCRMLRVNRAAETYLETPLVEILKQRCMAVVRGASGQGKKGGRAAPAIGEMGVFEEIHEPETDRHFEIRSLVCTDRSGRLDRVVQVTRDITYRKSFEKKQRILQARLAQAQKMEAIGTLAGGIAHDFNNILAAIVGYTQLAATGLPADSSAQPKLDQVLKASRRAGDLIYQILAFSRGARQAPQTLQMGLIVKEAVKLLRSTVPATIEIQQNIQSRGVISADPTQIHQIVMNLCTNAFHAMRKTGGTLGISLDETTVGEASGPDEPEHEPGEYLRLTVSDTGHGIPEDLCSRIFEPYFTTKTQGDGTGLGLATVHGIVKNHNGWIEVESAPGKGSTFHIYFPRCRHVSHHKDLA